ncbi:Putative phage tail protein [Shimia gijangensis]|uniref:Putative phage tail protein n=1 Tax=Shimia gijangensis TaxID=1470563 RepID=A0A1M6EHT9_9RHOB|nr:glycoside hydrolase TIM-barrel-like domain-containing protein [Shimia gijangensis]SHI85034.1 Putative phage tail protein [Shimia gijangensis]
MATLLLSAAGAAIGGSVGGTLAGVSSVAIGRLAGATLGRAIDQQILGTGSDVVDVGRVDRFRVTGTAEGAAVSQLYGRMRISGQVIWTTQFVESVHRSGGGKGMSSQPETAEYSYSVSLAIGLCEGEITSVGRVWADGEEVAPGDLNMRVYKGSADQLPDPLIEAVEGEGLVPAYRGTAYVVMENLPLSGFGNRVPQFTFEVCRPSPAEQPEAEGDIAHGVRAVALVPGTGEYSLATTPVFVSGAVGHSQSANVNSPSGQTDFVTSVEALNEELPNCGAISLVVSWFGNDLRCGDCTIRPKVERKEADGRNMPWRVSGLTRASADEIAQVEDRPVYGGTPTDDSVVEAITHLNGLGKEVMYYPFILMDQLAGNGLPDPWTGNQNQPVLPWRGRITGSMAPGQPGSPDGTAQADAEVAAFFGTASAADFTTVTGSVTYLGPEEWGYRRFILHQAALCALAGGVSAFCIGSEMRSLTQLRGAGGAFPTVLALRNLAAEVRSILGPDTRISYAADWSEYFGYHPQDGSDDVHFHLDPLWADDNIDFIGIDNYMPLSDWRDGEDHIDADWGSIYNPEYLMANVAGGEGYDWYYHSPEAREAQIRTEITDGAHNEPWVYRYKDIGNWWSKRHHNRIGGVRQVLPTSWEPQSKPIVFTEIGCAALDKATNQPNKFLDDKSSESLLPRYSDGRRDEFMQQQYLRAVTEYWARSENNPVSELYLAPMVDMSRAHVWAWDARPYPTFPNNRALWSDGENYAKGHWINGRSTARPLASVVRELCLRVGVSSFDVSDLRGVVRGLAVEDVTDARAALQPLMLRHGFDAVERDGVLHFVMRDGRAPIALDGDLLAVSADLDGTVEKTRGSEAETAGRIRVQFVEADGDFDILAEEAVLADQSTHAVSGSDLPLSLTRAEGRQTAERWLTEARVSRDSVRFALPPSALNIGAGDVVSLAAKDGDALYRVDRVEQADLQILEGVRIEPAVYTPADFEDDSPSTSRFVAPVPVVPLFLDLPLLTGDEVPHAPHLAVTAQPWPGSVAVYDATTDANYGLNTILPRRAVVGTTETILSEAQSGLWDHGEALQVRLVSGALESISQEALLNGGNLAMIGDGSSGNWELFQFRDAELIAPDTWWIRTRLRGQLGSDALMPVAWPIGSYFVLFGSEFSQIEMASSARNIARHYRIGPAQRGYDDPTYEHRIEAFAGNGMRPYAPCHLRTRQMPNGNMDITWIRRTRIDGDGWDLPEVPLGEESERYHLRVIKDGSILTETHVSEPNWSYTLAQRLADGATGGIEISIAQVSARYGAGLFATLPVDV